VGQVLPGGALAAVHDGNGEVRQGIAISVKPGPGFTLPQNDIPSLSVFCLPKKFWSCAYSIFYPTVIQPVQEAKSTLSI
jgi:hypothetical protein